MEYNLLEFLLSVFSRLQIHFSPMQETGYERLLLRQVKQIFLENKMIIVCQYNYIHGSDMVLFRHRLRKYNIHVKFFPNKVIVFCINSLSEI